jgi:hypothetical protein
MATKTLTWKCGTSVFPIGVQSMVFNSLRERGQWFKIETEPKLPGRIMVDVNPLYRHQNGHLLGKYRTNQGSLAEAVQWLREKVDG